LKYFPFTIIYYCIFHKIAADQKIYEKYLLKAMYRQTVDLNKTGGSKTERGRPIGGPASESGRKEDPIQEEEKG
jgi:hypothetical protein